MIELAHDLWYLVDVLRRCKAGELTGIELLARSLEGATVVHLDFVALLGLALADHGESHVNLELLGNDANGGRGESGEEEGGLHGGGRGGQ